MTRGNGRRGAVACVLIGAAVVLSACGGSSDGGARSSGGPTTAAHQPTEGSVDAAPSTMADGMAMPTTTSGAGAGKPKRPTNVTFDGAERQKLAAQLVQARAVALRYPTVADALAGGYELTTPYAPGTGAHYGKDADTQAPGQPLDVTKPQSLLYDGTEPTSALVGMMYVQLGGDEAPDGFAGPLDAWSPNRGQCLKKGTLDPQFPTKSSVTQAECAKAGGTFIDVTAWIQHVWVVPGWEAPGGVFAPYNDDIVCADGSTDAGPVDGCPSPASS